MNQELNRRTFIKRAAATGGGALTSSTLLTPAAMARRKPVRHSAERPNILVIMVDELRVPTWFPAQEKLDTLLGRIGELLVAAEIDAFADHDGWNLTG